MFIRKTLPAFKEADYAYWLPEILAINVERKSGTKTVLKDPISCLCCLF